MIKNARVVSDQSKVDEVGLNDTVTLYFEDDEEEDVYRLVTSIRGNSLENKISIESPLGKSHPRLQSWRTGLCKDKRQGRILCGNQED